MVWEQRQPMATYLVQLLTGDYEILERGPAGAVPIVDVALAADVEQMAPYFDLTDDQLAFFEPLFGPYPLDRYGLAFSDSPPGLAMEQQGRSLYSRADFPGGSPARSEHLLLSHELAHMWFGDAVSPADWSDLWLNESFATYAQWLWLDHAGLLPLQAQAAANLQLRQDVAESTGDPSVDNLFGFERYDGGAVVVHALRQELDDEAFFRLLQEWVSRNNGTSRHDGGLHRPRQRDRRTRPHDLLRRLALRRRRPRRLPRVTRSNADDVVSGRSAASAPSTNGGRATAAVGRRPARPCRPVPRRGG